MEAFVYCWTDHKTGKLYVGSHKGTTDDGYVCSSKWMMEEYEKRPEDFTRQIVAEGTFTDIRKLEMIILQTVNAALDVGFYNRHNGDDKFYPQKGYLLSEETKQKMRKPKSLETRQKMHQPKSEQHRMNMKAPKSEEHIEKVRLSKLGKKRTPFSDEWKENLSKSKKGMIPWNKGLSGYSKNADKTT